MRALGCTLVSFVSFVVAGNAVKERDISADTPSNQIRCWTTQGRFTLDVYKQWAPNSVKHFTSLVKKKYYDDQVSFARAPGVLLSQFGQHFDIKTRMAAQKKEIQDKDMGAKFKKGMISFASGRNTVVFIADDGAESLGGQPWERPFGIVSEGLDVVDRFYGVPEGSFQNNYTGSAEMFIYNGHKEIHSHYPQLDTIVACRAKGSKEYEDEQHEKAVEKAIALRKKIIEDWETPEMKLWHDKPSKKTIPETYIDACKDCFKTPGSVFCLSMIGCAKRQNCMSPRDEVDSAKQCTKADLFKKFPANFKLPEPAKPKDKNQEL